MAQEASEKVREYLEEKGATPTVNQPDKSVYLDDVGNPKPIWHDGEHVYENGSWRKIG